MVLGREAVDRANLTSSLCLERARFGGHLFAWLECWADGLFLPKAPPPYPPESKEATVRLFHMSGKSMATLAADLEIAHGTEVDWAKRRDLHDGNVPGITSSECEELRKLRREVRVLREGQEVLPRAATCFARETR